MELSQDVLDQIQRKAGADLVDVPTRVSENVWSVRVAYADGPTAYLFDMKLFDLRDGEVHIWGF